MTDTTEPAPGATAQPSQTEASPGPTAEPKKTDYSAIGKLEDMIKSPRLMPVNFNPLTGVGWVCAPLADDVNAVNEKLNSDDEELTCLPPGMRKHKWLAIEVISADPELASPGGCLHGTPEHPRRHWKFLAQIVYDHWTAAGIDLHTDYIPPDDNPVRPN